jgi:hypothetical protein
MITLLLLSVSTYGLFNGEYRSTLTKSKMRR